MDIAASESELRDAARLARESVVVANAVMLARWVGTGRRPVTAAQVLRKADIPAAGAALSVKVPPRPRTMADIRALHRPWRVAVATGLLQAGGGWVTGGLRGSTDPLSPGETEFRSPGLFSPAPRWPGLPAAPLAMALAIR